MSDENNDNIDLLLMLKRRPELKRLLHSFFLSRLAESNLTANAFRDDEKNKTFHRIIFGKGSSVEGLNHKHLTRAFESIDDIKASAVLYIEANIDNIPSEHDFNAISGCTDPNLPFYAAANQDAFFDVHLSILKELLGEDFETIQSRLLTETVDGRDYKFPAINLLKNEAPVHLNQRLNLKEESTTVIPNEFTAAIKSFMPNVKDNVTFTLNALNLETNQISCSVSTYIKTLLSCDRWFYEMMSNFTADAVDENAIYRKKPFLKGWAERLRETVIENSFSPDQSIGGACLCIYDTDHGYEYILGQKQAHANGFNELHVLPSFMFQPITKNRIKYAKELSVQLKVMQELAEEVFNHDEIESDGHDRFLQEKILGLPENERIVQMLKTGDAEFHHTGLWLDMYRLRPEVTSVLIIKDKSWFEEFITANKTMGNWELVSGAVFDYSADSDNYESLLAGDGGRLCAPGAAALISGMRHFKSLGLP